MSYQVIEKKHHKVTNSTHFLKICGFFFGNSWQKFSLYTNWALICHWAFRCFCLQTVLMYIIKYIFILFVSNTWIRKFICLIVIPLMLKVVTLLYAENGFCCQNDYKLSHLLKSHDLHGTESFLKSLESHFMTFFYCKFFM